MVLIRSRLRNYWIFSNSSTDRADIFEEKALLDKVEISLGIPAQSIHSIRLRALCGKREIWSDQRYYSQGSDM